MLKERQVFNYDKALINLKALRTNDKDEIAFIIKVCRLSTSYLWRIWKDSAGNTIGFTADQIKIVLNGDKVYSDLYLKKPPSDIAKQSQFILLGCKGENAFVWLYGNDGRLRYLVRNKGEWSHLPPLYSGEIALRTCIQNLSVEEAMVIKSLKVAGPINATISAIASPYPCTLDQPELEQILKELS